MAFADDLHEFINGVVGAPSAAETDAADATSHWLARMRPDLKADEADELVDIDTVNPDVRYGCLLVASRWVSRKGSPAGVQPSFEGGVEVVRVDPDAARLIGIGRARKPSGAFG